MSIFWEICSFMRAHEVYDRIHVVRWQHLGKLQRHMGATSIKNHPETAFQSHQYWHYHALSGNRYHQ